MDPLLLGYQQISALLERGEFHVHQKVVQLNSFSSNPEEYRNEDFNGLLIKCLTNGLFELSSHIGPPGSPFEVSVFVQLSSDTPTDLQQNLLPRFFSLLRSKANIDRIETSPTDGRRETLLSLACNPHATQKEAVLPFQLTDVDWVKINQAKSLLRRFTYGIDRACKKSRTASIHPAKVKPEPISQSEHSITPNNTSPVFRKTDMHQEQLRGLFTSAPELDSDQLAELKKHVINLNAGQFSTDGEFTTSKQEVQAIFERHIFEWMEDAEKEELDLVFYSHGGLTNEAWGLATAHHQVKWWKSNGVYPIFFVWETGLLETIWQLIQGRDQGARGFFSGIGEAIRRSQR